MELLSVKIMKAIILSKKHNILHVYCINVHESLLLYWINTILLLILVAYETIYCLRLIISNFQLLYIIIIIMPYMVQPHTFSLPC